MYYKLSIPIIPGGLLEKLRKLRVGINQLKSCSLNGVGTLTRPRREILTMAKRSFVFKDFTPLKINVEPTKTFQLKIQKKNHLNQTSMTLGSMLTCQGISIV